jgi:exopolyphosphatase/guanosine-5'-triphosphate,3'-diphosphate pyrophosphatase
MKGKRFAAINLGSESICMSIAELQKDGSVETIDEARQPSLLGKDSFYNGKISRETINACIRTLSQYKKLCKEYGVDEISVVAGTAVKESVNADILIDNIATATGLNVQIFSSNSQTEYVHRTLVKKLNDKDYNNYRCIAEIGAGNVVITIFDRDFILYSTTLPIGALRAKQFFSQEECNQEEGFAKYLRFIVEHELRAMVKLIPVKKIIRIYGIGEELEQLSHVLKISHQEDFTRIEKKQLEEICHQAEKYSTDEIIHRMNVSDDLAENFYPICNIFLSIINFLECEEIFIPDFTFKDCIVSQAADKYCDVNDKSLLEKQIIINSQNIGRTFNYDESHALKVLELSIKLFDQTESLHQLGSHEKCLLMAAAILHDIGLAISNRSHHKHSQYIVSTQNFFYYSDEDRQIIANIVRYHRKTFPKLTHSDYSSLSHKSKMTVCKLSAILRIADSLDNNHRQLVEDLNVTIKKKSINIDIKTKDSIPIEEYSFNNKKDLFEDFFGLRVVLKNNNITKHK